MLRRRVAGIRWRTAGSRGTRVRALAGVVAALGMGAATFMALSTLAVTHPKPQPQVVAGAFTTPSASPANPSPGSSPPASLPPRCHASQLAMKMMAWAGAPANEGAYLFLLRDNGPGDCTLSGAPTISWPRGVESNLQGGLLTAPPANGGKGLSENQAYGHGTSQVGPVVLTPDGVPAAFETVVFPGPGVKGIWACVSHGQTSQMQSWLYITLPGAVHSVAVPNSLFAPVVDPWKQQGCWTFGSTTAIYSTTVLAKGMPWSNPPLQTVPMAPVVLPAGTPAFPSS